MRRFVKAVQRLDLLDALGVHPLRAAVAEAAALGPATAGAGLGFGQVLLDRAARHKLHHRKGDDQHAQQGWQHQQQALENVDQHV